MTVATAIKTSVYHLIDLLNDGLEIHISSSEKAKSYVLKPHVVPVLKLVMPTGCRNCRCPTNEFVLRLSKDRRRYEISGVINYSGDRFYGNIEYDQLFYLLNRIKNDMWEITISPSIYNCN